MAHEANGFMYIDAVNRASMHPLIAGAFLFFDSCDDADATLVLHCRDHVLELSSAGKGVRVGV